MANVCIFGYGKMGKAAAFFMNRLGHRIGACDFFGKRDNLPIYINWFDATQLDDVISKQDLVISCATAESNFEIAQCCRKYDVKYCDLGGDENVHEQFRNELDWHNGVFTDLGLAPGLVNLFGCKLYKEYPNTKHILLYVGGISKNRDENLLGWIPTWSIEGLMKNYDRPVTCLEKGNIVTKSPFSDYHITKLQTNWPTLEAFLTSGGLGHTLHDFEGTGIETCKYFTLRWPGHVKVFKYLDYLIDSGYISNEKAQSSLIEHVTKNTGLDFVYVHALVVDKDEEIDSLSMTISSAEGFTAMQIATAGPLCIVADMMLKDDMKGYLTYKDIDYHEFENSLSSLIRKCNIPFKVGDLSGDN